MLFLSHFTQELGGLKVLEEVMQKANWQVSDVAKKLLVTYFGDREDIDEPASLERA